METALEKIKKQLEEMQFEVEDLGTNSLESVDYPDFGAAVGREVASGKADEGIVVCGSGIGIAIAANKIHGKLIFGVPGDIMVASESSSVRLEEPIYLC